MNGLSREKKRQEDAARGKHGGWHFGAHTLHLTKVFPGTYSALTFKKKILTRHIHMPYSHHVHTRRTHTPYTHAVQQSQLPVHGADLLPTEPVHRVDSRRI